MPDGPVLVILDDEALNPEVVRPVAERHGFGVVVRGAKEDPVRVAREERAHAVLMRVDALDDVFPLSGPGSLPACCRAVVVSSRAPVRGCATLAAAGAYFAGPVPLDSARLARALEDVQAHLARRRSVFASELAAAEHFGCCGMVGRGPAMQAVFERVRRVAPWLRAALIAGEPGTGKRRLAHVLHAMGPRHARPFVVVGDGDRDLAESQLFGPSRGPWELSDRRGLVELADGGVVYVADPSRLSADGQRRLLDLLEDSAATNGGRCAAADLTILAGCPRDPHADVRAGRLNPALLAALSEVELVLPPLRQRREDIAGLTAVFLREAATHTGRPIHGVTVEAEGLLHQGRWPGNVEQLRAVVEQACLLADGELVGQREVAAALPPDPEEDDDDGGLPLSRVEREHILRALQRAGGNKKAAARVLGVSRRALYRKLERLDLAGTIVRRPRERGDNGREVLGRP